MAHDESQSPPSPPVPYDSVEVVYCDRHSGYVEARVRYPKGGVVPFEVFMGGVTTLRMAHKVAFAKYTMMYPQPPSPSPSPTTPTSGESNGTC